VVTAGRNAMPAFGEVLTPEQIRAVAAFVAESLADESAE
jgi:mono/diheme cytochrome c family protein